MEQPYWKKSITQFLAAQTVSLFGSSLVQYAIIWHITITTSSGKMLTISTLCGFLPQIFISLFAGVWIDRYDRKKMIIFADIAIASSTLFLAIAFMSGYKNIWFLFAVLVVRSFGTGIQAPTVNAIIPQIVPKEHLIKVSGVQSTLSSCMMFLSPAISGAVLSVAPLEATLLIDVVTAIVGVGITSAISIAPYVKNAASGSAVEEFKAGFTYLKQNCFVRNLIIFQLVILFLISPSAFLTPLMVNRTFGAEVWRLTASEMTYSLGMVLGGLLISTWGGFKKKTNTTLLAGGVYGLLMIALGAAPIFAIYLLFNTLIGITAPCYNAPITVSIQETVEQGMQGRVFGFMQIASSCALPMGMLLFGPMADKFPVQNILFGSGIGVVLVVIFVWRAGFFDKAC